MKITVPDCFDNEWQSKMLRQLAAKLKTLKEVQGDDLQHTRIEECEVIVEALREYSGY